MMAVLVDDKRTMEELRADCVAWENRYNNLVIVVEEYLKESKKNQENLARWLDKKMQS